MVTVQELGQQIGQAKISIEEQRKVALQKQQELQITQETISKQQQSLKSKRVLRGLNKAGNIERLKQVSKLSKGQQQVSQNLETVQKYKQELDVSSTAVQQAQTQYQSEKARQEAYDLAYRVYKSDSPYSIFQLDPKFGGSQQAQEYYQKIKVQEAAEKRYYLEKGAIEQAEQQLEMTLTPKARQNIIESIKVDKDSYTINLGAANVPLPVQTQTVSKRNYIPSILLAPTVKEILTPKASVIETYQPYSKTYVSTAKGVPEVSKSTVYMRVPTLEEQRQIDITKEKGSLGYMADVIADKTPKVVSKTFTTIRDIPIVQEESIATKYFKAKPITVGESILSIKEKVTKEASKLSGADEIMASRFFKEAEGKPRVIKNILTTGGYLWKGRGVVIRETPTIIQYGTLGLTGGAALDIVAAEQKVKAPEKYIEEAKKQTYEQTKKEGYVGSYIDYKKDYIPELNIVESDVKTSIRRETAIPYLFLVGGIGAKTYKVIKTGVPRKKYLGLSEKKYVELKQNIKQSEIKYLETESNIEKLRAERVNLGLGDIKIVSAERGISSKVTADIAVVGGTGTEQLQSIKLRKPVGTTLTTDISSIKTTVVSDLPEKLKTIPTEVKFAGESVRKSVVGKNIPQRDIIVSAQISKTTGKKIQYTATDIVGTKKGDYFKIIEADIGKGSKRKVGDLVVETYKPVRVTEQYAKVGKVYNYKDLATGQKYKLYSIETRQKDFIKKRMTQEEYLKLKLKPLSKKDAKLKYEQATKTSEGVVIEKPTGILKGDFDVKYIETIAKEELSVGYGAGIKGQYKEGIKDVVSGIKPVLPLKKLKIPKMKEKRIKKIELPEKILEKEVGVGDYKLIQKETQQQVKIVTAPKVKPQIQKVSTKLDTIQEYPLMVGGKGVKNLKYRGAGLYETTEETIAPTSLDAVTLNSQIAKGDALVIKQEAATQLKTESRTILDTKSITDTKIELDTRQVPKEQIKSKLKELQAIKSLQVLKTQQELKEIQLKETKLQQRQQTIKKPLEKPKPPRIKIPIIIPETETKSSVMKKVRESPSIFKVFTKKQGKDVEIAKTKDKEEAVVILKKKLIKTLRASGYIEKNGRKLQVKELDNIGIGFRVSKKDSFRLIEKKEKRLKRGTQEVPEIQAFRKGKKKSKNKNIFGI